MIKTHKDNAAQNYIELTMMDGRFYRLRDVQRVFFTDRAPFGEKDILGDSPVYRGAIQLDAVMESGNEAIPVGTWLIRFKRNDLFEESRDDLFTIDRSNGQRTKI